MTESLASFAWSTLYFTRLTVSEDGVYLPLPSDYLGAFCAASREIPAVRAILDAYAKCLSVDLLRELERPYSSGIDRRVLEAGMYAAFAFYLEAAFGLRPRALAFYSSGVAPALMFARALSPVDYIEKLAPFHSANRKAYVAVEKCFSLAQARLEAKPDEDLESFVEALLKRSRDIAFIKDRRHRHTLLIAGEKEAITRVCQTVAQAFASVAQNPKVVETSSAHLPLYDRSPLEAMLKQVVFDPPHFQLIGIDGERIEAGCDNQDDLRRVVYQAAFGFLDTGRVVRKAAQISSKLLVIGSRFGARVLDRVHLGGYPKPELATSFFQDAVCGMHEEMRTPHK